MYYKKGVDNMTISVRLNAEDTEVAIKLSGNIVYDEELSKFSTM